MFDYPVILTPDDGTLLVTFPDVPEAITFGANEEEALSHAVDALETALSFYVDDRKPLPVPSVQPGLPTVRPISPGIYQAGCVPRNAGARYTQGRAGTALGMESPAG
jgi:antitoxin HicB